MGLKPTFGIGAILASRGRLFCLGVSLGPMLSLVQWEICEIDSGDERRWRVVER